MENYFNFFTEIEECYRRCRDTPTLLSPLDWALIESWKEAGIPLAAILLGIERAFAKFQKRPRRIRKVNSLSYCTQQVMSAAEEMRAAETGSAPAAGRGETSAAPPFTDQEIQQYLSRNADLIERASRRASEANQLVLGEDLARVGAALREAAASHASKPDESLQDLERQLSALEEMISASLTRASDIGLMSQLRGEVERSMAPHRRNLTAPQVESLERQLLKKRLFEHYRVPRLSLFYL